MFVDAASVDQNPIRSCKFLDVEGDHFTSIPIGLSRDNYIPQNRKACLFFVILRLELILFIFSV